MPKHTVVDSRCAHTCARVRAQVNQQQPPYAILPPPQVLTRIFPLRRGLYEDYLGNWWCVTSVLVKWKSLASGPLLARVCAVLTLLAAAPSMAQQILAPSPQGLLLAMANSGFAFFMFGYQVGVAFGRGCATSSLYTVLTCPRVGSTGLPVFSGGAPACHTTNPA